MNRIDAGRAAALLVLTLVTACGRGNEVSASQAGTVATASARLSTDEALRALASRRVYFAHQSVGGNIVEGLDSLLARRSAGGKSAIKVVKSREPASVSGPAFVHFDAGRNEDPASKNADFLRMLDARATRDSGLAMLKYCYVDVNLDTDIDALFREYRRTIADVRTKHPDVTIVHITMPLTTDATGPKAVIKQLLGRPTLRDVNLKRSHFNEMLRKEFSGEPIFDLARLESTRPDGSREQATLRGETVYALVPAYSSDGRHLNAEAQRRFADELLAVLAAPTVR